MIPLIGFYSPLSRVPTYLEVVVPLSHERISETHYRAIFAGTEPQVGMVSQDIWRDEFLLNRIRLT
jgi:hypothetical protein